jgi:hypothetical protein
MVAALASRRTEVVVSTRTYGWGGTYDAGWGGTYDAELRAGVAEGVLKGDRVRVDPYSDGSASVPSVIFKYFVTNSCALETALPFQLPCAPNDASTLASYW